jgi:Flp pilus assembly protein TadG
MPFAFPRKFHGDRRGNVAMMYALAVPVLLFGAGLAIDFTHAAQVRTELNAAADAAVLAALTPSMMQQSSATAQTAAQNMFNGQIAGITSLASGDTTVTITIVNPNNNPLIRNVTVAYTAQNENIFASVLGAPTFALAGSSTASASMAANINFYLLLDNSPSMALPATAAGITEMENLTPQQGNCAFACHQAGTNILNGDTMGNPCLKGTTYTAPTLSSPPPSTSSGNTYCATSAGTQIDDFALAHHNGIELRLDALSTGVGDLMSDAYTTQQNAASIPPVYQFAAYAIDSSWQIGMSSSNNYNNLMAMTVSYVSGWTAAAPNFGVMEYYANNAECNSAACTSSGGGGDYATSYSNALGAMNTIMPNPGQGTNVAGDTPQEVLFIVTDGVEDDISSSCSEPETSGRCQAPINPALCTTIKNRGIRIAILYTDYYQVTSNTWYVNWIEPFNVPDPVQTQIATNLQACASPGLYYDAGVDSSQLGSDLQALFNTVVQTAHLTQ